MVGNREEVFPQTVENQAMSTLLDLYPLHSLNVTVVLPFTWMYQLTRAQVKNKIPHHYNCHLDHFVQDASSALLLVFNDCMVYNYLVLDGAV